MWKKGCKELSSGYLDLIFPITEISCIKTYLLMESSLEVFIFHRVSDPDRFLCAHSGGCCLHRVPGRVFAIPKPFSTLFFWGDLGREQYQSLYYGVNSDGINRSVHCVHYILEQKKSHENSTSRDSNPRHSARRRAWVWCLTHRANWSDANGRCIFLFIP